MKITPKVACRITLSGYFLLLTLLLAWPTLLSPPERLPVALVLMIAVIPLLFPLRGLLYGRRSSYIWAAYLSLFYLVHALTVAGALEEFPAGLPVGLELGSSLLLFFGAVSYLRHADRQ
ncbi:MAG: DUF2069 domain-containing protein [Gammaproteobacteria bacterium]